MLRCAILVPEQASSTGDITGLQHPENGKEVPWSTAEKTCPETLPTSP